MLGQFLGGLRSRGRARRTLLGCGLALALCGFTAPVASAAATDSVYFSCSSFTYYFSGFPNANENTVTEVIHVDGVLQSTVTFKFNGPTGSNTVPVTIGEGHHSVDAFAKWHTNGANGSKDITLPHGINCPPPTPILFVHGFEGSGAQFESQAQRFESNGYPKGWVATIDYDSSAAVGSMTEVDEQIDKAITQLKARTGASQVILIGHSLGTSVSYNYLAEGEKHLERDKNVAAYINIDGQEKLPPVPTLALWAEKSMGSVAPIREIKGATNVLIFNETHVQTATSAVSFIQMYKWLHGVAPKNDIVPQKVINEGPIELAGRALDFPVNTGLAGDTLKIWPVNGEGFRSTSTPAATISIATAGEGEGDWGPVIVQAGQRYEFSLEAPGQPTLHIYYPAFPRNDYQVHLLASPPFEASGMHAGAVGMVSTRYKEMWGNAGGLPGSSPEEKDELKLNGLNICVPAICPLSKVVNAIFIGEGTKHPKETNLEEPNPLYSGIPFITGAEVFIGATSKSLTTDEPTESVKVQLNSRGEGVTGSNAAKEKTLEEMNVPNWNSSTDQIELEWHDYEKLTFAK